MLLSESAALETIKKGNSIEVIRTEQPHGHIIEVAYLLEDNAWVIRVGGELLLMDNQQELIHL